MTTGHNNGMEIASQWVQRLRGSLAEHFRSELDRSENDESDFRSLGEPPQHPPDAGLPLVEKIVRELEGALTEAEYEAQSPNTGLPADEQWTFGSIIHPFATREIHLGFVRPLYKQPIVKRIPINVVQYILSIPGGKDVLKREHHNQVGWHYHYLNDKRKRSDTVLCWDPRVPYYKTALHPLFREYHAEGRADFRARPDLWGDTKRKSVYDACRPDLDKWPLNEFRCPSKEALLVWP